MTASESPSLVFRNTSFTARQRFTPASACSTLTRTRASFRFLRFSAAVSSPPRGFFFRLASFLDRWLIPLEAGVLVQDRLRRVADVFLIGHLLVVALARTGTAQEADALAPHVGDDHVLVGVGLLFAGVVRGLFFRVFRPLTPPVRAIDDQPRGFPRSRLPLGEAAGVTLRAGPALIEGRVQDGQQAVNTGVHPALAQLKELPQESLEGVGLKIDQQEQQLLYRCVELAFATAAGEPLAGLPSQGLVRAVQPLIGLGENGQQDLKFPKGQSGEGQELPPVFLKLGVHHHEAVVFTISNNVYCKRRLPRYPAVRLVRKRHAAWPLRSPWRTAFAACG